MSTSFDFTDIEQFTAGAVGEPGSRVFYLQVRAGGAVVSFRCEKQQVGALGTYLATALSDLPALDPDQEPTDLALVEPVIAEWVIGSMGMAYDERSDRLVLLAQELVPDGGEDDPDDEDPLADLEDEDAATARFHLTREQAAAFVALAEELLSAGRPPCPVCGMPMNPEGHNCPRSNGHGRP
jgi:uncharacterized repeat protein (TIGR03847 family)